jgi:hypothetical protein
MRPNNASNNMIEGKNAETRLEIPSFTKKLSDNYNGIILNQGFNISLINNDGKFDDEAEWNLFNSPITIKKSNKEVSEYADFIEIAEGIIESTETSFDSFNISAGDLLSSLSNPVCDIITTEKFADADENQIGKSIPILFGKKLCKLIKLSENIYLIPDEVTAITNVYDSDGKTIIFMADYDNRTIMATNADT